MTTHQFTKILIDRDVVTKIPKVVPPWHVPVYRAQYGDARVIIEGVANVKVDEEFDARTELDAMRAQFGVESDTKQAYSELVYGRGPDAVKKMEEAIKASGVKGDPEPAQKVIDGKVKQSEEVVKARAEAYRHPVTGEKITPEEFAKAKAPADPVPPEAKHRISIESSTPIRATDNPAEADRSPTVSRTALAEQSRLGFASSEASRAAEEATIASGKATAEARHAADPYGYETKAVTTKPTTKVAVKSGKSSKSGKGK